MPNACLLGGVILMFLTQVANYRRVDGGFSIFSGAYAMNVSGLMYQPRPTSALRATSTVIVMVPVDRASK
jgi:hypothetical protein